MQPEAPFWTHLPIRIRFGDGVVGELPALLAEAGLSRPFLVIDPAVASIAPLAAALEAIAPVAVWRIPAHEPTTASVEEAGAALAASDADVVIAVGGGSALDTAKGARIVAHHGPPVRRFAWPGSQERVERSALKLVTVPTTAGTGSEVTGGCVMYHDGHKVSGASPLNRADIALVDPELTHGLPAAATLYTGADALAQAIAGVVVRVRTPIGDGVGLEATRLAGLALPAVVRDGSDAAARNLMMLASMMAGLTMNIAEAGTEHALAEPLGSAYGLPHGLTVGLMLAESMDVDRRHVPDRFERVADALGEPPAAVADGSRAVAAVRRILAEVGLPTLRSVGASEDHVDRLTDACLEAWIPVEPGPWSREDIAGAYRAALAIERR